MRKLTTLKRNIVNHKAERQRAANRRELENRVVKAVNEPRAYPDVIMDPPRDLIDLYRAEVEVFARERILGDNTYTRVQMADLLDTFLKDRHKAFTTAHALAISNRQTYWQPSARLTEDQKTINIYLGHLLIGTIS